MANRASSRQPARSDPPAGYGTTEFGTIRSAPTKMVKRSVDVIQDLYWDEAVAAMKLTAGFADIEAYRNAIVSDAFKQTSLTTRYRYAGYVMKWFLLASPDQTVPSLTGLVPATWRAFKDEHALTDVMRFQYLTNIPLAGDFVAGLFHQTPPGEAIDDAVEAFLYGRDGAANEKTRGRLKTNLRKIGLVVDRRRVYYRVIPEVSPKAICSLLAHLFAPQPNAIHFETLALHPWWRLLGLPSEQDLASCLRQTAKAGLIATFQRADTLEVVTTKYGIAELLSRRFRK